jgi:hypothetical protein
MSWCVGTGDSCRDRGVRCRFGPSARSDDRTSGGSPGYVGAHVRSIGSETENKMERGSTSGRGEKIRVM